MHQAVTFVCVAGNDDVVAVPVIASTHKSVYLAVLQASISMLGSTPALHHAPSESVQGTALPVAGHGHLLHQVLGLHAAYIVGSGVPNRQTQSATILPGQGPTGLTSAAGSDFRNLSAGLGYQFGLSPRKLCGLEHPKNRCHHLRLKE